MGKIISVFLSLILLVSFSLPVKANEVPMSHCKPQSRIERYSWGYKAHINNCMVMQLLSDYSNAGMAFSLVGAGISRIPGVGLYGAAFSSSSAVSFSYWKNLIEQANYKCGMTGIVFEGNVWSGFYPIPKAKC